MGALVVQLLVEGSYTSNAVELAVDHSHGHLIARGGHRGPGCPGVGHRIVDFEYVRVARYTVAKNAPAHDVELPRNHTRSREGHTHSGTVLNRVWRFRDPGVSRRVISLVGSLTSSAACV